MAEKVGSIYYDVTLDTSQLIDGSRKVDRELGNVSARLTATAAAAAVLAAALAAIKVAKLADEFRLLGARVEVAAGNIDAGAAAMSQLVEISRRTQSSLAGNVEVFTRLNQSIQQMGGTQRDTLQLTELLAKAIKVSGANAVEAKAAMLQFGQALGSGKLAGDELRSLLETAPYLMRQLADGIGVPVGALKKLGEEGKLTADVVTNALTKAAAKIDEDFKKFPQTIESAMQVAQDAAILAAAKLDELTGTSAALTGATKGLGEVLDKLAGQFGAANDEAGKLGRNQAVSDWAGATRTALSYVIDAADLVWQTLSVLGRNVAFVFKGIGTEIGGIAAQAMAVARGDLSGAAAIGDAMKEDADRRRKDLDTADAKTLGRAKLAGQAMRDAWEQGAGGGRGFVNPQGAMSALKSSGSADEKKGGAKFDASAYLAALEKSAREGYERIDAIEREQTRKADAHLKAKQITQEQHAQAITLIQENAAKERQEVGFREATANLKLIEDAGAKEAAALQRIEDEKKRGQTFAAGLITDGDPVAKLQAELAAKSELLLQAFMIDQGNEQLYAQAKVALEEQTAAKIREIREKQAADEQQRQSMQLQTYASLFGNMADLTKQFSGKQSGIYKAMFAASKAFAIADSIIKIQQGIAGAAALPFPANIPAIGTVIAATSGIISTISGANYGGGRQYGGPVNAGSLYRVNETGRPEMFTAANGNQYMMPTRSGSVTPADKVGGGGQAPTVIIQNLGAPVQVQSQTYDSQSNTVTLAIAEVASQISNNSGPVWSAMRGATNVQGRL